MLKLGGRHTKDVADQHSAATAKYLGTATTTATYRPCAAYAEKDTNKTIACIWILMNKAHTHLLNALTAMEIIPPTHCNALNETNSLICVNLSREKPTTDKEDQQIMQISHLQTKLHTHH